MHLRRATSDDYRAVGALTVAAYEPFLLGPQDAYREQLADVAARDRDAEVWVAIDEDPSATLLGNITVCPPSSPWREISHDGEGEFRMLAVAPSAQGRGVGRLLAELALARFRGDGATAVVLSTLADMSTAHRLYERLGFLRLPERDWSPEPGVDLIAYRLDL